MAPIRPLLAAGVIAVSALTGCADDESASDACGEPLATPAGELRTVLQASSFGADALILGSAALPDGSVVVAYDANPEEAGGEEDWVPDPGLVLLRGDGSCASFPLPLVDGLRVGLDAQPVAVDADGRLYLWDHAELRLVRGPMSGAWETLATFPTSVLRFTFTPAVTVSRQGEVYIATGFLVSRVTAAGEVEAVAGTGEAASKGRSYPPPDLGDFPRPGASSPLPNVSEIAATPSGGVVITVTSAVLELDPSGTLNLIADPRTTAGQDGAIEARHMDDTGAEAGSVLGAVEVTAAGDVLVSDVPQRRIIRIRDGRATVFARVEEPSYMSLSRGHAFLPDEAGLLVHEGGGQNLAVLGLAAD